MLKNYSQVSQWVINFRNDASLPAPSVIKIPKQNSPLLDLLLPLSYILYIIMIQKHLL